MNENTLSQIEAEKKKKREDFIDSIDWMEILWGTYDLCFGDSITDYDSVNFLLDDNDEWYWEFWYQNSYTIWHHLIYSYKLPELGEIDYEEENSECYELSREEIISLYYEDWIYYSEQVLDELRMRHDESLRYLYNSNDEE